ncbi:aspartate:alanine exchanger family transporter [uncultured Corynebacterium sp.]|uniref:aspartate:alanine exchanger family transporter n=1 Tax=uncultured Corynebacterium sp. TaxID=159447 RepID=UPI0025F76514|nr:aspartate:alanine exchanger family transporter [uncultured Corynebacterium sp.]
MLAFLAENPLIALVIILALGFAIGKIRIGGMALGTAAILFVAIIFSTLEPNIQLPPLLFQFGLAVFVYAIGLTAGHAFFADFRERGWRMILFVVVLLIGLMGLTWLLVPLLGVEAATATGSFSAALTSTPGMAAVVDMLESSHPELAANPVVGYSLAYPGGVLGAIAVAAIGAKLLKVNHRQDAIDEGVLHAPLEHRGVRLREGIEGCVRDLRTIADTKIIVTRLVRPHHATEDVQEKDHKLAYPDAEVRPGMIAVITGTPDSLDKATAALGEEVHIDVDSSYIGYRRITVSNPSIAGRSIKDIDPISHGFIIARIRRGDEDLVPGPDDVLQYSDRVRVVTPKHRIDEVSQFLGDSERSLADVNLLPFTLGLAIGLLIGAIPIPLPGGATLNLGFGGGPIVMGLVLGALARTGPIGWQIPYHANKALSSLGLAIFLAGVGTIAGTGFRDALTDITSLSYIALGFIVTVTSALSCGLAGVWLLRLKWDEAMGMAAGFSTNPAVISYLNDQADTELPMRGYATVYPAAMIGKIIGCQVLLLMLL